MTSPTLDEIVHAVLYEGYILYPYRASSTKNRRERFTFGRVYPKEYSESQHGLEPCLKQTECLLQADENEPSIEVTVRFLHPMWREVGQMGKDANFQVLPMLSVGNKIYQTWQEATEREVIVSLGPLSSSQSNQISSRFYFPASRSLDSLHASAGTAGAAIRRRQESLEGTVEVEAKTAGVNVFKITVRVFNQTPLGDASGDDQDAVIMRTFASTHTILRAFGGEFISLLDPPAELGELAAGCQNVGTWPVLVGDQEKGQRDTLLSSPIILYDYPRVAPESVGSFCDGTEIDEMLALRVLTMTDKEKVEMRDVDEYARRILERTENMNGQDLMKLHGIMREAKASEDFFNPTKTVESVFAGGVELRTGDSVKIRPRKRADAIDMMLTGKTAIIEAIEEDAEGCIHLALVLEDDPGKDLGMARQPGHRFFYQPDEVEPLQEAPV